MIPIKNVKMFTICKVFAKYNNLYIYIIIIYNYQDIKIITKKYNNFIILILYININ